MSALTKPSQPARDSALRPVPWIRMAWVIWRQHRVALSGVSLLVALLALLMWALGHQLHDAYSAARACHPAGSLACGPLANRFDDLYHLLGNGALLQPIPALIGAFIGAPLLARELETGTFRYAWTQGFGRWRWTLAKLVMLAVIVAAAGVILSMVFSWYYRPYFAEVNDSFNLTQTSTFASGLFDLRGVALPAWTLVAFAIGGLAGMLIRRVVPAIIATLAAYIALAFATGMFLRQHYLTPLVTRGANVSDSAWTVSQWGTKDGRFAFAGQPPLNLVDEFCPPSAVGPGKPSAGAFAQCLSHHGYTLWTSYQPVSRFWSFQWIEAAWLFGLSVLLIAATVRLVRRRAT